jgi:cysteine desulfurase
VNSQRIYLDNAATTPPRPEAIEAMEQALAGGCFNPSSLHLEGRLARARLDAARERVAAVLGASRKEIAFTGSGTEADNLAILGVAGAQESVAGTKRRTHVVASAVEHHAVLHSLDVLRERGYDVTLVPVDAHGRVDPAAFAAALRPGTLLASVMYVNNEIGTVQPVAELARIAHERGVLFHTDAIQAPHWLPIDVRQLGVDLLALSGHKFRGPKGVGVLYAREGVALAPLVHGGGQEFGRRSGTENVPGIAALARALELAASERPVVEPAVAALRDRLESGVTAALPDVRINGAGAPRAAGFSSMSFARVSSEALLIRLDLEGIAVSAGSACTSGALEPSHVIAALGGDRRQEGVIRFSLATTTTQTEIDRVLEVLPAIVESLREGKQTLHSGRVGDA